MITGPYPPGHWTRGLPQEGYRHFEPGRRYRVVREFLDFDRDPHPVGEEWTYLGTNFLPYDDGRSLFVSLDGEQEWHIRMQDRPEEQGEILDNLARYVEHII